MIAAPLLPGAARAQISPGPLARAHQSLEGVTKCLACHELGESVADAKCLACHLEIAALREAKRGFHGITDRGKCASCHPDHGGLEFALVEWEDGDPKSFDHSLAGWELEGKHAALECSQCHKPELHKATIVTDVKPKLSPGSFLALETACAACHDDPHEGKFGTKCQDCHGTSDFHAIRETGFDHDKTRYPLRGAHRTLECRTCHDPVAAWGKKPAFEACSSCHDDPHQGRATLAGKPVDCQTCHKVERFFPSTFTVAQHATTKYPLAGKHSPVDCDKCHRPGGLRGATSVERAAALDFHPESSRCADCHRDAHGGQLASRPDAGACESCHRVEGFSPSRFTAADHVATAFPLEGAHADVRCSVCHGPERPGLPPPPKGTTAGSARIVFRMAFDECVACHRDPHESRFAQVDRAAAPEASAAGECLTCHDTAHFAPSSVDADRHAKFDFRLEGAHRAVPCFECHKELKKGQPRSTLRLAAAGAALRFEVANSSCRGCHEDPHGGQFDDAGVPTDCASCHGPDSFEPAVHFDHERDASFSLKGPHEAVSCDKCHLQVAKAGGTPRVIYRPIDHRCEDCHASSIRGGKP